MNHVSGSRAQRLNAEARWGASIAGDASQRPMGMRTACAMATPPRNATRSRGLRMGLSVTGLCLLLAMSACSKSAPSEDVLHKDPIAESAAEAMPANSAVSMAKDVTASRRRAPSEGGGGAETPQQRFVAVRHQMQVEAPAAKLADVWTAVREACGRLDCEVLTSELQRETAQMPVSAKLTMRVAPNDYNALSNAMGGEARVVNYGSSSEDKTSQVIDVEAHIKNRSEYRDSLRELLTEKNVKRTLSELFEIRDTLSNVQAEIDSAMTQRKVLAQETSKQFVQMHFEAERGLGTPTQYSPWRGMWREAMSLMSHSALALVQVLAVALPWLALLGLLAWPMRVWLRRRAKRLAAQAQGQGSAQA